MNKKAMRQALISVISQNQKEDRIFVIDKLELDKASSKAVAQFFKTFGLETALVVNVSEGKADHFNQSARNLTRVKYLKPEGVNVFDVLKFKNLVISAEAVKTLTERLTHV